MQPWPQYYNVYYQQLVGGDTVGWDFPWVFPWEGPIDAKNKAPNKVKTKLLQNWRWNSKIYKT